MLSLITYGCAESHHGVVWQNGTIDALLDGNYDGEVTIGQVRRHGDFGLGTFNGLDGEMVDLEGQVFQVRPDGAVRQVGDDVRTPFAVVTAFEGGAPQSLAGPMSFHEMQARLDQFRAANGHAAAIRIDGRFAVVRTRSVPRQDRPYRRLADVVKGQSVFELKNVSGTLVGLWFPPSLSHVNVPGYHFHFIADDRSSGGHVLDLTLLDGTARIEDLPNLQIALPGEAPTTRLVNDREQELRATEK